MVLKKEITVLQCNSSYPTPLDDVNLNILKEYKKRFNVKKLVIQIIQKVWRVLWQQFL